MLLLLDYQGSEAKLNASSSASSLDGVASVVPAAPTQPGGFRPLTAEEEVEMKAAAEAAEARAAEAKKIAKAAAISARLKRYSTLPANFDMRSAHKVAQQQIRQSRGNKNTECFNCGAVNSAFPLGDVEYCGACGRKFHAPARVGLEELACG